jgi:amidase
VELVGRPATELAAAVRGREVSAVDVVRAHLDQLAAVEHRLGAFVLVRGRRAVEEAEALDGRDDLDQLPLAGVPIAVKDVIDVAGEPTRRGSLAPSPAPVEQDAEVVAALRAAGAIVLGKTRGPELSIWGTSDTPAGTAVSPWDPSRSAGGSAGGSGAAVAAGIVPIALGVDGLGDTRIPAAACGAVGIRPGNDIAPVLLGGEPHWFGMSRHGVIATTVADTALAVDLIARSDHLRRIREVDRELTVAVSWRSPAPGVVVTSSWREASIEAGRLLRHVGHDVTHEDPPYDRQLTQAIIARSTQGVRRDAELLELDVDELEPRTRAHVAAGERLARVTPGRDEDQVRWRDKTSAFFDRFDLLVTPAFARTQPDAGPWHPKPWAANLAANISAYPFMSPWNLADHPSLVLPLWSDGSRPLSVQLVARAGNEDLLLAVAAQLEATVPWQRHAPGWGVPELTPET